MNRPGTGSNPDTVTIRQVLNRFFNSLDRRARKDPTLVALHYAKHFTDSHRLSKLQAPMTHGRLYNLAIGSANTDLAALTKRVMLISDTLLLSHFRQGSMHECHSEGSTFYVRCPDLAGLGQWLIACEQMLRHGALAYHPDLIKETKWVEDDWADTYGLPYDVNPSTHESTEELSEAALAPLVDLVVHGRKIVNVVTKDPNKVNLVRPILEVDLPFLEGLKLADYINIIVQETAAYETCRDHLRKMFLRLDQEANEYQHRSDIAEINIAVRDGIRLVKDELERVKRRRAVAATGAAVASTPAMLVAVSPQWLTVVAAMLGIGGGAKLVYDAVMKEIDTRPTPSQIPCYYLWLLQKRAGAR